VIGQSTPLITTALVAALGLEAVGWRRWSATLVGFAGVLVVLRPTSANVDAYGLLALASAGGSAARDLLTRSIGFHISSTVITLTATIAVTVTGAILGLSAPPRRKLAGAELAREPPISWAPPCW
jgi:drug/metabolite transporter (DMT)-like permease